MIARSSRSAPSLKAHSISASEPTNSDGKGVKILCSLVCQPPFPLPLCREHQGTPIALHFNPPYVCPARAAPEFLHAAEGREPSQQSRSRPVGQKGGPPPPAASSSNRTLPFHIRRVLHPNTLRRRLSSTLPSRPCPSCWSATRRSRPPPAPRGPRLPRPRLLPPPPSSAAPTRCP